MNYYDEEISIGSGIGGGDVMKPPNNVKVERISSRGSIGDKGNSLENTRSGAAANTTAGRPGSGSDNAFQKRSQMVARPRQRMMVSVKSG